MITPDYYEKFRCIGGLCRHNCCKGGWDIEVDDEAFERFCKIGGAFGEKVKNSIDEDRIFKRTGGGCPLLNDDGLCEMVINGHELCVICDEYPRFTEYYDDYAERGISLSCEEAARVILDHCNTVLLQGKSGECDEDIFCLLLKARRSIFDILQNRNMDILKRLRLMLDYGAALQERINENDFGEFSYIPSDKPKERTDCSALLEVLSGLDILNDEWKDILETAYESEQNSKPHFMKDIKGEQLAVYFVYRYFLKAVFDCDALSKLKLAAVCVLAINSVYKSTGDLYESARMFSIEVEHDEDNIDALYDEFLFNDELSYENIIKMLA